MKGDVSLGKKFVNLISSSIWISIKNFSEARGFLLVLRSGTGDSTTSTSSNLGQNPKALVYGWRQILTLMVKISSFNASLSANKVSFFKLTIEE